MEWFDVNAFAKDIPEEHSCHVEDFSGCPRCGAALQFSHKKSILRECGNLECDYVEYFYQPQVQAKKGGNKTMDMTENWNKIVDFYHKNRNALETQIQKDWENLFAEKFGYSRLDEEIDNQRSIQIGSTDRIIPDIIIRSSQENQDLFVVELKQHTSFAGHQQLFSYLKQLKLDIGVLVCNKLYIYDYDTGKDDNNQPVLEIEFTKDNPDGIKFVELFSKDSFDKESVKKFIRERKEEREKEQENIRAIQQKVTTDYVKQLLQNQLAATYSQTEIQQALKGIDITVERKGKQPAPPPVFKAAAGIKQINIGTKDNTQYSVDGDYTGGKCPTAYEVVSRYISKHPSISYSELYAVFPDEAGKPGFAKCIRLVEEVTPAQWNGNRFNKHPLTLATGEQVVVSTQWTPANFNNFMHYAARAGITVTSK